MTRKDILESAMECVCGQREQDYGSPEDNFQLIANLWNDYLYSNAERLTTNDHISSRIGGKAVAVKPISSTDVSMMMALLKIARIKNGGGTGDSFVDLAGYAACGGELNDKIRD